MRNLTLVQQRILINALELRLKFLEGQNIHTEENDTLKKFLESDISEIKIMLDELR